MEKQETKTYIMKCNYHFPGYEILFSESIEEARAKVKKWNCNRDTSPVLYNEELAKKYSLEFKKNKPKEFKMYSELF